MLPDRGIGTEARVVGSSFTVITLTLDEEEMQTFGVACQILWISSHLHCALLEYEWICLL